MVELHNHTLIDNPRLFYLHFCADADAEASARAPARAAPPADGDGVTGTAMDSAVQA